MKDVRRIGIVLLVIGLLLVLAGVVARLQHWYWPAQALGIGMLFELAGIILLLRGQRKAPPQNKF